MVAGGRVAKNGMDSGSAESVLHSLLHFFLLRQ
jgi:hypothetical protein